MSFHFTNLLKKGRGRETGKERVIRRKEERGERKDGKRARENRGERRDSPDIEEADMAAVAAKWLQLSASELVRSANTGRRYTLFTLYRCV